MSGEYIRARLGKIVDATASAANLPAPGWWVGDAAGEQQVKDDIRAGRVSWRAAHGYALRGLEALDRGEIEYAELALRSAETFYGAALEARMSAAARKSLATPAGRRGAKPRTTERNRRLAEAFEAAEAQGKKGRAARIAAVNSDAHLKREFEGARDSALKKAIELGRNRRKK